MMSIALKMKWYVKQFLKYKITIYKNCARYFYWTLNNGFCEFCKFL